MLTVSGCVKLGTLLPGCSHHIRSGIPVVQWQKTTRAPRDDDCVTVADCATAGEQPHDQGAGGIHLLVETGGVVLARHSAT
ncbi:hypothetical protein Elgi_67350 [Paenibacillus elgii]|uniref:hypothetical protein n=1 Tax=Paenibacillus elgii TaxID=189691 RepID=UPI002D7D12D8|nr:hypothetical protein Elgi_67350 [Paenibacillus elgii]